MGEKTTIEIDNIRELKQHALDTNKTLKQLINEAIMEKIQRERQLVQKGGVLEDSKPGEEQNVGIVHQNKVSQLKKRLTNAGLLAVVEKECHRHNMVLNDLSPETLTPKLLADIQMAVTLVFDDETAEQIIHEIENLFG
jgi:hypothetical protein